MIFSPVLNFSVRSGSGNSLKYPLNITKIYLAQTLYKTLTSGSGFLVKNPGFLGFSLFDQFISISIYIITVVYLGVLGKHTPP